MENLFEVEPQASSGLHERDAAEVNPVVEGALGHGEPFGQFCDVYESG